MNDIVSNIERQKAMIQQHFETLHRHPELAFEENQTATYIAKQLRDWGYEVTEGIGKTGIVATLRVGDSPARIGLRADIDALPVQEANQLDYQSQVQGKSHTCGHDGHSSMLLGAAKYLAESKNFNGTLNLIFQPAEEIMGGAPAMIADGLFEKFPMDKIFGLHNMPSLALGKLYFTKGAVMAAVDNWEIELTGKGSHGAMPEKAIDAVVAGAALVMSLQTIVSRNVAPMDTAVITVGAFLAGDAGNVIAQTAILRLSTRTSLPAMRETVLNKIRSITKATAEAYGVGFEIREGQAGAVLVNDDALTDETVKVTRALFGDEQVIEPGPTFMASEDFAFYAQKIPAVYGYIGNGNTPMVHHPEYVFDQSNLTRGAAYWVGIAEHFLPKS